MTENKAVPGCGDDVYVPYDQRKGNESIVYFSRDLSAEGLRKMVERVDAQITGKVAIKLHTGEQYGPNIIPHEWVENLVKKDYPDATIVETNTYYVGDRYTTELHRETLQVNGWTFCPVDITDSTGITSLPVNGGKWFKEMFVGRTLTDYDSLLVLTHFKGHVMGGFGGSNKNIGIGCADGRVGKAMIHSRHAGLGGEEDMWTIAEEELMERIAESTKATIDYFGKHVTYVNVMRNMSVDCDCAGCLAEKVVTPNVGILASTDILALDQACVDMIFALDDQDGAALCERILTRHGLRQLSYMKELGMGNDRYILLDTDNQDARIQPKDAVVGVQPFVELPIVTERRLKAMAAAAAAAEEKE